MLKPQNCSLRSNPTSYLLAAAQSPTSTKKCRPYPFNGGSNLVSPMASLPSYLQLQKSGKKCHQLSSRNRPGRSSPTSTKKCRPYPFQLRLYSRMSHGFSTLLCSATKLFSPSRCLLSYVPLQKYFLQPLCSLSF